MYKDKNERIDEYSAKRDSSDEIDVTAVLNLIKNGFEALGNAIAFVFILIFKKIILISSFVIAGLVLGFGIYQTTKPYYTSSMTLVLSDIRNEFIENQLNNLSSMITEGNFVAVSSRLDIDQEAAMQIKQMSFYNLDANRIDEDSVLTGSPFQIELSLYDNNLFETMQPALTNYLENNQYFSKQKRIKQREIESMIAKLRRDIASLDSVKSTVASPRGPVNGFVYGSPVDPTNLFREGVIMYNQLVELEAELDQLDNIQVVSGFTPRLRPTGPNVVKYLAIGGVISFIIGLIVALVLESKKRRALTN